MALVRFNMQFSGQRTNLNELRFAIVVAEQLDTLISQARKRLHALKKRKPIAVVRATLRKIAQAEGYSLEELFGGLLATSQESKVTKKRSVSPLAGAKVPPKYRNPANHAEVWSGRGLRPVWLATALKRRGAKLEQFLIRKT